MAKFDPKKHNRLSGLIGNVVISGNTVRSRPRYPKNHEWSDSQKKHRLRFTGVIALYRKLNMSIVKPIWSYAAKDGLTSYNLFIKENMPAFGSDGKIKDPCKLKLSIGSLPQAFNIKATHLQLEPGKLKLNWENDENISKERKHDKLMIIFYNGLEFTLPLITNYNRVDMEAIIEIPLGVKDSGYIYAFWGNSRKNAFSHSQSLEL